MELVSAVISTHERPPEIVKRALLSVERQTYRNIEIIVVDDSGDDYPLRPEVERAVREIAAASLREITYIPHERCQGACAARNTGLARSRGEIIGFLDDDDEWLSDKVEVMLPLFADPAVGLVYGDNELVNETTGETKHVSRRAYQGDVFDRLILSNFIGSTSFPLLRRESLVSIGGFDEQMLSAQDADVWLRMAKICKIEHIPRETTRYYVHEGEQISKDPDKKIAGLERLNEKNAAYLAAHKDAYWTRRMKLIPFYLQKGDKKTAAAIWRDCAGKQPQKLRGNLRYLRRILTWEKN